MKTKNGMHGAPVDDNGELAPVNKLLVDPVQYYKQQSRLNKWKKRKKLIILLT